MEGIPDCAPEMRLPVNDDHTRIDVDRIGEIDRSRPLQRTFLCITLHGEITLRRGLAYVELISVGPAQGSRGRYW